MKQYAILPLFSFVLAGCGGGSSDANTSTDSVSQAPVMHTYLERVSGDIITVDGKEYSVNSVSYMGEELDQSSLNMNSQMEGMSVKLIKHTERRFAVDVTLEPTFTGTLKLDPNRPGYFYVNNIELFFDKLSSNIKDNTPVMVSALPTADQGYKVLSVIEFHHWSGQADSEGIVSALDLNQPYTFKIGRSLTVDYSKVSPNFRLENGQWVEVVGMFDPQSNTLTAEKLVLNNYSDLPNDGEIEGLVTWVNHGPDGAVRSFELNYRANIQVNPATEYDDGTKYDLVRGAWVEVELRNNQNKLMAKEIEFEESDFEDEWQGNEFELTGTPSNVDDIEQSFVVKGRKIYTDARTEYEDNGNFEDLMSAYQEIEVEGIVINGDYVAREIEIED